MWQTCDENFSNSAKHCIYKETIQGPTPVKELETEISFVFIILNASKKKALNISAWLMTDLSFVDYNVSVWYDLILYN